MRMPRDEISRRGSSARTDYECIDLLLQGGGALGAYQAGVYEALAEEGLDPDWVAGISIGAINSAIIAGNELRTRIAKLRQFWEMVTEPAAPWRPAVGHPSPLSAFPWLADWLEGDDARRLRTQANALLALGFGALRGSSLRARSRRPFCRRARRERSATTTRPPSSRRLGSLPTSTGSTTARRGSASAPPGGRTPAKPLRVTLPTP
jgi:hypothetical protein